MEEINVDSSRKVGGSTSTSTETVERPKELSPQVLSPQVLEEFRKEERRIYNGLKSTNNSKAQLLQKCKSNDELDRTWKLEPLYWTEIRSFIEGHSVLKDYVLGSDGMLKLKPPVSTSSGVTIIIANKNELPEEVARNLGLQEEQKSTMIGILTTFDIVQKRNGVYQKIKVDGEWEEDTQARRKSLLKTEAERIIKEWKVTEQKQIDEQMDRERFEREKEEARLNDEKQASVDKEATVNKLCDDLRRFMDPKNKFPKFGSEYERLDFYKEKLVRYQTKCLLERDKDYKLIQQVAEKMKAF
jgi:hypothetical protein